MNKLLGWYIRFKTNEKGAAATEYALIVVLVALAIIIAAGALGTAIAAVFQAGADKLDTIVVP